MFECVSYTYTTNITFLKGGHVLPFLYTNVYCNSRREKKKLKFFFYALTGSGCYFHPPIPIWSI